MIGLLLGLQRERTPSAKAGLGTFALVAPGVVHIILPVLACGLVLGAVPLFNRLTLSSLNLFAGGGITVVVAVTAIGIAYLAAVAFKLPVVLAIGGIDLLRRVALALLAPALGIVAGLLLFA